jgi:hypothetical protein
LIQVTVGTVNPLTREIREPSAACRVEIRHEKDFGSLFGLGIRGRFDACPDGRDGHGSDELTPAEKPFEGCVIWILHGKLRFCTQKSI